MTPHFTSAELTCKCGCGMLPRQDFMDKIERVRVRFGKPMHVTGPARCPKYNNQVSTTGLDGPHTTGRALDIGVRGEDALKLILIAVSEGITGIGVSQKGDSRFIHLDDIPNDAKHPRPYIWSY